MNKENIILDVLQSLSRSHKAIARIIESIAGITDGMQVKKVQQGTNNGIPWLHDDARIRQSKNGHSKGYPS